MNSSNPFDDGSSRATVTSSSSSRQRVLSSVGRSRRSLSSGGPAHHHHHHDHQPPIWAARHVEWPIPSVLSLQNYQRLVKASRQAGQQLGITVLVPNAAGVAGADGSGASGGGLYHLQKTHPSNPQAASGGPLEHHDGRSDAAGSESNYFSGLMSRVLNTSAASDKSEDDNLLGGEDHHHHRHLDPMMERRGSLSTSRPIRPPRPGCVAAANGWIVAALECPAAASSAGGGGGGSNSHASPADRQHLRLVSRWNVRRGGKADHWMALPPAVEGNGRIAHLFVDPTASHTLLSAANGEAYYLHSSSQRQVIKLAGFGRNADGTTLPKESLTGVPGTAVAHRRDEASQSAVQAGLSLGSYVTAVAWDKERGTEGSSKRILLGTSAGEIYEYSLVSPTSADQDDASALPVLLHKLYSTTDPSQADPTEVGAAVTGLYFERLRTGLLVLASTSGRNKRTRFYTFYSAHNKSFRMVMADQQHASLVELPGSVDFADLRLCNDHFGLRTATGLYYGTIDRSLSGPATLSGSSSMIVDSGILPYEDISGSSSSGSRTSSSSPAAAVLPVSLALTPNHLITLSELNNIRFINRVAQKIIQKEHVDMVGGGPGGGGGGSGKQNTLDESHIGVGEFLMDIRRPDQVWLRKGRSLVHISSSQEDRDVWKYTLKKCIEMPIKGSGSGGGGGHGSCKPSSVVAPAAALAGAALSIGAAAATPLTPEEKAVETLFEQAKSLCTNNAQKAVVTAVRAEYHLSHGRAELAAKYLAASPPVLKPFADTAIRLALPKLGIEDSQGYDGSTRARASLEANNLPLITYLSDKMRGYTSQEDSMTCTMLGAWLSELILHDREELVGSASSSSSSSSPHRGEPAAEGHHPRPASSTSSGGGGGGGNSTSSSMSLSSGMLSQLLNTNSVDAKTVLKILASHDVGPSECAHFAAKSGDIATAVNAALSTGENDMRGARAALQILYDAPFQLAEPLYYKHALTFLSRVPSAAGDAFLAKYELGLSPLRLLPSMMNYERMRTDRARVRRVVESASSTGAYSGGGGAEESKSSIDVHVGMMGSSDGIELKLDADMTTVASFVDDSSVLVKYFEGVIKQGCRSSAVYSYLVSLYIKLEDEEPLLAFLSTHVPVSSTVSEARKRVMLSGGHCDINSDGVGSSPLDMSYALRAVLETGRHFRSAVKLYMGFGMRQQAVSLALKVDPVLARELAQDSVEIEERKRLWLMIAKNAASDGSSGGRGVVARVVAVLKDCGPDVLSIEDVLPFLPDFTRIDEIKDEICEALTSYSTKIDSFLKEMSDCDQTCDSLRGEIARLRNHQMQMRGDARCAFSNKLVLAAGEPFYVFPSGYVVLVSALKKQVMPYLNEKQRARVGELESMLLQKADGDKEKVALQRELDGLLAAECPLTGSVMVESIDKDFDDDEEAYDAEHFLETSIDRVDV